MAIDTTPKAPAKPGAEKPVKSEHTPMMVQYDYTIYKAL
jgi:hypothetical protein